MNKSINVDGISFRLLEDGSLLLTTPRGQYQVRPQGVAALFDLLCTGQGGFLDATPDLPTWAKEHAPDRQVIGYLQADEEKPSQLLENYRETRKQHE